MSHCLTASIQIETNQERKRKGEDIGWFTVILRQWQETARLTSIQIRMSAKSSCKVLNCSVKITFSYFIIHILLFVLNTFLSIPVNSFLKRYTSVKDCVTLHMGLQFNGVLTPILSFDGRTVKKISLGIGICTHQKSVSDCPQASFISSNIHRIVWDKYSKNEERRKYL